MTALAFLPELLLVLGGVSLLFLPAPPGSTRGAWLVALVTVLAGVGLYHAPPPTPESWFVRDALARLVQVVVLGGTLGAAVLATCSRAGPRPLGRALGALLLGAAGLCLIAGAPTPQAIAVGLGVSALPLGFLVLASRTRFGQIPTATIAWLGTALLISGAAQVARLALVEAGTGADADSGWRTWLAVAALAAITLAHLWAARQRLLRELISWLVVGQAGYLFLALAWLRPEHADALVLQAVTLLVLHTGGLALVVFAENELADTELARLAGLGSRNPWLAAGLALTLATFAAFPPTLGFLAKVQLCLAGLAAGQPWLVAVALFNLAWVAWILLRVLRLMCFDVLEEPTATEPLVTTPGLTVLCVTLPAFTLWLGLWPGTLAPLTALWTGSS